MIFRPIQQEDQLLLRKPITLH